MFNSILQQLGHTPIKSTLSKTIYKSPFNPSEKTPSFFIFNNQRWNGQDELREHNYKCNSTGNGGNIFDFMMKYYNLDFVSARKKIHELSNIDSVALGNVSQNRTISNLNKTPSFSLNQPIETYEIKKTSLLQNKALLQYLEKDRGISQETARKYTSEVYYRIGKKSYFAIAFYNNIGGMEIRNKYFKGSFGKKGYSTISPFPTQDRIKIFEGFLDFLSYIEINGFVPKSDYVILNSLSLLDRALNAIGGKYELYELYYDNDNAGDKATQKTIEFFGNCGVIDKRDNYQDFKDLNEFWINRKRTIVSASDAISRKIHI